MRRNAFERESDVGYNVSSGPYGKSLITTRSFHNHELLFFIPRSRFITGSDEWDLTRKLVTEKAYEKRTKELVTYCKNCHFYDFWSDEALTILESTGNSDLFVNQREALRFDTYCSVDRDVFWAVRSRSFTDSSSQILEFPQAPCLCLSWRL